MTNEVKPITIKADVMWAYTFTKNPMTDKYTIDLCNLSDKAVLALEEMGIETGEKEGKGSFIVCKSNNTIKAYDRDGTELAGIALGNGSKARAVIGYYDWNFKGKKGRSPSLIKLVIDDLVVFEGGTPVDADEEAL